MSGMNANDVANEWARREQQGHWAYGYGNNGGANATDSTALSPDDPRWGRFRAWRSASLALTGGGPEVDSINVLIEFTDGTYRITHRNNDLEFYTPAPGAFCTFERNVNAGE